jgi:hypothetical protein
MGPLTSNLDHSIWLDLADITCELLRLRCCSLILCNLDKQIGSICIAVYNKVHCICRQEISLLTSKNHENVQENRGEARGRGK